MSNWLDHSSIVGKIGGYGDKYLNPISWITGGKSTKLTSTVLPEKVNSGLSAVMKPAEKIDKTINPVRKIKFIDHAQDIIAAKPGDAAAIAAGAFFGGSAALAGGAGGGAGATGGGLVAGGGGTAMGSSAGVLGAADSAGASTALGLTAGDVGGTAVGGGTAMGGAAGTLGAADSSAASSQLGLTAGDVSPSQAFAFNSAQDSQLANEQGNLSAVTDDDTLHSGDAAQSQQNRPQQQQRKRQQQAVPFSPISGLSEGEYQALVNQATSQIAQSSKTVKTRGATQAAMQRGLAGAHPVDTNGVHVAAIQELNKQIDDLGAQIAAAKAKRSSKGARA